MGLHGGQGWNGLAIPAENALLTFQARTPSVKISDSLLGMFGEQLHRIFYTYFFNIRPMNILCYSI